MDRNPPDTPEPTFSVRAPASLSNLGPGFDTLGVAITGIGDIVSVTLRSSVVSVRVEGDTIIPTAAEENTASVAALEVFRKAGYEGGADITVDKGIPYGSGLGGSAASAAAGAAAANASLGNVLSESTLIECALAGEAVASKSIHGDNVIPALVGGAVLVDASQPTRFQRLALGADLFFAIVIPDLQIQTAGARRDLPSRVEFRAAVNNASALALLVHAMTVGDAQAVSELITRDRIVEPLRAANIPCFAVVFDAALHAGAGGCAISGSGPTLFAVLPDEAAARRTAYHMSEACKTSGLDCRMLVAEVEPAGARSMVTATE